MKKIRENKVRLLITGILLLAAFLRLYNISHYQTFLGDEGRDVLIAKGILEGDFTLLGPRASAGDFFLGPIYYYFMAPFLLLSGYDPVGPAIMVALLSVATVYLIYRFGKEWFGVRAGLMAGALYAVSPLVIAYSRSSWNPNPMPFFSLLILYLLYRGIKSTSWKTFVVIGILFGITMQLHYLAVFLGVIMGAYVLLSNILLSGNEKNNAVLDVGKGLRVFASFSKIKNAVIKTLAQYALMLAGFLIGISPFLLFEIRHGFPNTRTIINFILTSGASSGTKSVDTPFVEIIENVFFRLFGRLVMRYPSPELQDMFAFQTRELWHFITLALAIASIIILIKSKNKLAALLMAAWLFFGVVLFGFYKKNIYDYYFVFMFPLPFLLIGNMLGEGLHNFLKKKAALIVGILLFTILFIFNLMDMPFRYPPHNQKQTAENIADFILSKTDNKPYNFALITKGNSDHAYRYFFHIKGRDPVVIDNTLDDPQRSSVTDQLLVLCDFPDCQPLGHPLFDVAGFGQAEIVGKWEVEGMTIYKLVPFKGGKE